MKKSIIIILFILSSALAFAQGHISFKGVPLDGTLKEYISKMQDKGFEYLDSQDGMSLLMGDFAGFKGCVVGVSTLDKKDVVAKIAVIFPECSNWSSLEGTYLQLKDMLSEKYGKPVKDSEKFQRELYRADDNTKFFEAEMGRCEYYSVYENQLGSIQLEIVTEDTRNPRVRLSYFDNANGKIVRNAAMDDL